MHEVKCGQPGGNCYGRALWRCFCFKLDTQISHLLELAMSSLVTKGRVAVAGLVALLGAACYGVILYPMKHAEEYMRIQDEVRKGIDREQIQPGGMRIWSDPFKDRVKEEPLYIQKLRKEKGGG